MNSSQNQQTGAVSGGASDTKTPANSNSAELSGGAKAPNSMFASDGAIGKQFNPDGNIGQLGEKVGGPFSKDGVIGSQFDASKGGIAGKVEEQVGGPKQS